MRFFNTAGPVNCAKHYCLSPLERFDLFEIKSLIMQEKYFILHAPRQTGKTTSMLALVEHLNVQGEYAALYCNVETAQTAREDVKRGMHSILVNIFENAGRHFGEQYYWTRWKYILSEYGEDTALKTALNKLCPELDKPLVLVIDEIDSLVGDTLISVLRQLRSGYTDRPNYFPQSIILCGVRDIRDYRIHSSRQKEIITGGSAFNVKAESLRLGDFVQDEVYTLLEQHTNETGQEFSPEAKDYIWHLSQGQPWLVNALAYETCFRMKSGRDRSVNIDKVMVDEAEENLITRRETHLDQLADKLQEERVRRIVEPLLEGVDDPERLPTDDIQYVEDLGLIKTKGQISLANPIYQEIVPRELTYGTQVSISQESAWYVNPQGSLDMEKLISAFQEFFREHSESWLERFQYKEAGPQLLMQAFLQRIINSGGRIEREYGKGRRRIDLLVLWPLEQAETDRPGWTCWHSPVQKVVIELKILYKSLDATIAEGLKQTSRYMDLCGTSEGHLVIFDRREQVPWEEKIFTRREDYQGMEIVVWGM